MTTPSGAESQTDPGAAADAADPDPDVVPEGQVTTLWAERTGTRTYTGRSSRGAQVLIGPAEAGAVFTPGELMKIALAGCTGMSADAPLARRLGDDMAVTVHVSGTSDPEEERYKEMSEELVVDLSGLDEVARRRLVTVVERAIDRNCTVSRTITRGAAVHLTITGEV